MIIDYKGTVLRSYLRIFPPSRRRRHSAAPSHRRWNDTTCGCMNACEMDMAKGYTGGTRALSCSRARAPQWRRRATAKTRTARRAPSAELRSRLSSARIRARLPHNALARALQAPRRPSKRGVSRRRPRAPRPAAPGAAPPRSAARRRGGPRAPVRAAARCRTGTAACRSTATATSALELAAGHRNPGSRPAGLGFDETKR